jgi:hypothetical protein
VSGDGASKRRFSTSTFMGDPVNGRRPVSAWNSMTPRLYQSLAGESEPASPRKDKRKGESVEERRARIERTQGRGAHSGGQRDKGGGASSGLNRSRGRGRR